MILTARKWPSHPGRCRCWNRGSSSMKTIGRRRPAIRPPSPSVRQTTLIPFLISLINTQITFPTLFPPFKCFASSLTRANYLISNDRTDGHHTLGPRHTHTRSHKEREREIETSGGTTTTRAHATAEAPATLSVPTGHTVLWNKERRRGEKTREKRPPETN